MKVHYYYFILVPLILGLFNACKSSPESYPCLDKLNYHVGQNIENFPEKNYASIPSKSKLNFVKHLGQLDTDTLHRKAIKYYWDDSNTVKFIEYGIMNNDSPVSEYRSFTQSVFLQYFDCVPGFKEFIETNKWESSVLESGPISINYMADDYLSKVIVKLNE